MVHSPSPPPLDVSPEPPPIPLEGRPQDSSSRGGRGSSSNSNSDDDHEESPPPLEEEQGFVPYGSRAGRDLVDQQTSGYHVRPHEKVSSK